MRLSVSDMSILAQGPKVERVAPNAPGPTAFRPERGLCPACWDNPRHQAENDKFETRTVMGRRRAARYTAFPVLSPSRPRRLRSALCLAALLCAATGKNFAAFAPLSGVPSLDAMAGDWIPMDEVANPPAVHNFNQMLVVGRDLASFYCNPGGLFAHTKDPNVQWVAGYPRVGLAIDGHEFPAVETRCYAYKALRRNLDCNGIAVETDTRMVNEQRGVLCRILAGNSSGQPRAVSITLRIPGVLHPDGAGVLNRTQRRGVTSAFYPSCPPDAVEKVGDSVLWTWHLSLPPNGTAAFGFAAGDETSRQEDETARRVASWSTGFDAAMAACQHVWEDRWADAFKPGNGHFSGNLPVLSTADASLARNYYMGVQTMLALERTQFPVSPRSFITSGERGDGIQYYWDASMQATAWALLEPSGMKATLRRWLVQNPRSGAHLSLREDSGYDATHHDRITGYAFNACTIFTTADQYLRITGDRPFLDEKLADGASVLDHLDALATDWQTLPKGPQGLTDYGGNGNLLECAPSYIHFVPSLNAQDVWMMRRAAEWRAAHGEPGRAAALNAQASAYLPAVLGLYQSGAGVWNAYHAADRPKVELRHCVDFIYVGNALKDDLTATQKSEMNRFVRHELFMDHWMRAMSLQDAAAAKSDRPDHGPMGAYDGWIPLTVGTLWRLGDPPDAFDFYRRTAVVTREGPFAQAREFYGPRRDQRDAPVRVAERRGCMKECISGAAFCDVVISVFFGFSPAADGSSMLADPGTARPFEGTLSGLRYQGKLWQLVASRDGVTSLPPSSNPR
jgi:hypothetical protein